ncbi:unnamed protein product [Moneuplotes crassus]|uniref:carbonic anhydrase n=2 Tax=Euplotes crassus TaxID=5936 RepID=A0AAD1UN42_EUPCR|nr:unnamed protein product [Moneuplotes crassus]
MIGKFILLLSLLLISTTGHVCYKHEGADWETGACASGSRQSPINIITANVREAEDVELFISGTDITTGSILYHDHELKVTYSGATAKYTSEDEDSEWALAQFHYHAPAEHRIDGKTHDLEMHSVFVSKTNPGQLLVVGVIYELEQGYEDDEFIASLALENLVSNPTTGHIENVPMENFYNKFSNTKMYNYKGSLTTPPCTESVEWFVVKEIQKINPSQLGRFTSKWAGLSTFAEGKGSNRVAMDLNRRKVFVTGGEEFMGSFSFSILFIVFLVISVMQIGLAGVFTLKLKSPKNATSQKFAKIPEKDKIEGTERLNADYNYPGVSKPPHKYFQRSISKEI